MKISITEFDKDGIDSTGFRFAHELGHNLGMDHDFLSNRGDRYDSNGVKCGRGLNALMDYLVEDNDRDKISTCSKEDFKNEYNKVVQRSHTKSYCLTCGKPFYCFFL